MYTDSLMFESSLISGSSGIAAELNSEMCLCEWKFEICGLNVELVYPDGGGLTLLNV